MGKHRIFRFAAAATLFLCAAGFAAAAEESRRKEPSADVPAEKYYKNIQVLTALPSDQLFPAMNFMADSLGVKCSYCHVTNDTGRWPMEKDDKAAKNTARKMIRMMRAINDANFKGNPEVTCATCHHGSVDPASMPPLLGTSAAAHAEGAPEGAPSVDAVLEKYTTAVGGRDAMAKVRNRQLRGTFTGGDGTAHPAEISLTADGKYRSEVKVEEGSFTLVYDGTKGTSGGPTWNNPMRADEKERIVWRATLFPAQDLKSRYPALAVRGKETIEGREAWMVAGRDAAGRRVTFWF
ncbi:MAG TPA: c-type cytochrome, partial [Thermoanaerobaculia bacterium]|nr:c-type cytochrome [Thermoanaerobaculia bacterium]